MQTLKYEASQQKLRAILDNCTSFRQAIERLESEGSMPPAKAILFCARNAPSLYNANARKECETLPSRDLAKSTRFNFIGR